MTTLFDRPIDGEISHYGSSTTPEQHAPEELLKALDAVLDIEGVEAVRWTQYTPYFNDGDACEFGVNEARVRIAGDDEEVGEYSDGFRCDFHTYEWNKPSVIDGRHVSFTMTLIEIDGVDVVALDEALTALDKEMDYHEILLRKTFGDPAEVTATKAGFQVEHYEHD